MTDMLQTGFDGIESGSPASEREMGLLASELAWPLESSRATQARRGASTVLSKIGVIAALALAAWVPIAALVFFLTR